MSRLEGTFRRAAQEGRAAFIAYLTAGDPAPGLTPDLVSALVGAGTDVIELGVPFSDPLADGPVNQRAAERALARGTTLDGVLEIAAAVRAVEEVPLVLFTYFNPIHRMGVEVFARRAADAGVDGVLVTDLPVDEAASYLAPMRAAALDTVFLAAPTSGPERLRRIADDCRGFLYYVTRTGVTGDPGDLPAVLSREIEEVRACTDLPVALGFGIASTDQVRRAAAIADGVVVGSALVARIEEHGEAPDLPARLASFAAPLVLATRRDS